MGQLQCCPIVAKACRQLARKAMVLQRVDSKIARPGRLQSSVVMDSKIATQVRHMSLMEVDSMSARIWLETEEEGVVVVAAAAAEEVQLHMAWQLGRRSCIC
jgi:hypothetical protein